MEKDTAAKGPGTKTLLNQFEFIRASKPSDIPALCELEQSENISLKHAASKRRHVLEKYKILLSTNPRAHISKGRSHPDQHSRIRTGEANHSQRF